MARLRVLVVLVAALVMGLALACSGSLGEELVDCSYDAFSTEPATYTPQTQQEFGAFEQFVRVRADSYRQDGNGSGVINSVSVEESVHGSTGIGGSLDVYSSEGICLEAGTEYYLLLGTRSGTPNPSVAPTGIFPVLNNRVTLSQVFRKDDLVGRFHGLDPVLFKRRLVEFVGRTDVAVD